MLSFDRDTALIVAVVVCIAATLYMFREFGKTKNDLYEMRNLVDKHDSYMYSADNSEYEEREEEEAPLQVQEVADPQSSQMNVILPVTPSAQ